MRKNTFTKFFGLCIIGIAVAVFFSACGCAATEKQIYMTRAEWISILGSNFDLTTFQQETPYYSDVPASHTSFTYVQACYEWDILRDKNALKPDEPATRGFVAETAVLAALPNYDNSVEDMDTDELLQYAVQNGIVPSGKADDKLTAAECAHIITSVNTYYLNLEMPEYSNISIKDTVVDYSSASNVSYENGIVSMPENLGAEIDEGTIIIIPGYPYGTAVKATSVETVNGKTIIETTTPELEEVFDELEFSFTASPKIEDIVPLQDGITIIPLDDVPTLSNGNAGSPMTNLSYATPLAAATKDDPLSFGVEINFTKGTLTPNVAFTDYFSLEAEQQYSKFFGETISEDAGELLKRSHMIVKYDKEGNVILDQTEEWSGGYEITGNLSVRNLYVEATGAKNLKSFACELHFEIDSSLSIKGKLEGAVPVYETVIPGVWGTWVKVVFSVYIDVNGELTVGAEIAHTTNVTYENKKFKTVQNTEFDPYISISASVSSGIKGEVIPTVLGIQLFDVSAKAGAELNLNHIFHATDNASMICLEGEASFPIVSISIGVNSETLANKLGIRATFKLVDKSGAPIKSFTKTMWHYEITPDGIQNVNMCTWGVESGEDMQKPTIPVIGPTKPGGAEPYPPAASEGLEFTLNDDGESYSVIGIGTCTGAEIVIPSTYDDLPVTRIRAQAFYQNDTITSIRIPDSVTTVEGDAIQECSALTDVFIGCGLQNVYTNNFNMIFNCRSLTNIEVSGENPYFKTVDGNMMSKDGKLFVLYAIGKPETSFQIPDGVETIGRDAFAFAEHLENIIIPNGVNEIQAYAFWCCNAIEHITIPDGVITIGRSAFSRSIALKSVSLPQSLQKIDIYALSAEAIDVFYYRGTITQWQAILKTNNWDIDCGSYTIYCIDGQITSDGTVTYN